MWIANKQYGSYADGMINSNTMEIFLDLLWELVWLGSGVNVLWIPRMLLVVYGYVILWLNSLVHCTSKMIQNFKSACGDINSWVRVTVEVHEH